jgi:hypothetical protein
MLGLQSAIQGCLSLCVGRHYRNTLPPLLSSRLPFTAIAILFSIVIVIAVAVVIALIIQYLTATLQQLSQ